MWSVNSFHTKTIFLLGIVVLGMALLSLTACHPGGQPVPASPEPSNATASGGISAENTPGGEIAPNATPLTPEPTPEPPVAQVNGEFLSLAEYEAELERFQAALQSSDPSHGALTAQDRQRVLQDLIDGLLLAQQALQEGFQADASTADTRMEMLASRLGGEEALKNWMAVHHYDEASFRRSLQRSSAAAWMRDRLASAVPTSAEQVHARQILLYNVDQATEVLAQLQAGGDFTTLAEANDPLTAGDLGWFARGTLTSPELEAAAFSLEPKKYSPIIQTPVGFVILQVLERDAQRPLTPEARRALQKQAVQQWLQTRRSQSQIQVLQP